MNATHRVALAGAVTLAVFAGQALAQQKTGGAKQQIVGVWALVSSINTAKDGKVTNGISFGPNPAGRIVFTSGGQYVTVNTNPNLPRFKSGNRMQGTAEEYKAVVHGSIASFGTYSVSPDGKVLALKAGRRNMGAKERDGGKATSDTVGRRDEVHDGRNRGRDFRIALQTHQVTLKLKRTRGPKTPLRRGLCFAGFERGGSHAG